MKSSTEAGHSFAEASASTSSPSTASTSGSASPPPNPAGIYREGLNDDYYGIKVTFEDFSPISDFPTLKTFVFSGHDMLIMLLQSTPQLYEIVTEPLAFRANFPYPVKALSPMEWLDAAQLPQQAGGNTSKNPRLTVDLGGRKISILVPSDKYAVDMGELPPYVVNYTLRDADGNPEYHTFTTCKEDGEFLNNAQKLGLNPVRSNIGKGRLSYSDFFLSLQEYYGSDLNSPEIVKICRDVLNGKRLPSVHAPVIPVMLATQLLSETSRNRANLIATLLLLDLMEARVNAPSGDSSFNIYRFENVLWHPEFYRLPPGKKPKALVSQLSRLGGFHPMAHQGSWSEEFKETPYQSQRHLTWSHAKSVSILIQWLCHLPEDLIKGMKITRLNKAEYHQEKEDYEDALFSLQDAGRNINNLEDPYIIIVTYLHPLIQKRLSSFEFMLSNTPEPSLSDAAYLRDFGGIPITQTIAAKTIDIAACEAKDQQIAAIEAVLAANELRQRQKHERKVKQAKKLKLEKLYDDMDFAQPTDDLLRAEIENLTSDNYLTYLTTQCPSLTAENYDYCRQGLQIEAARIVFLICKLYQLKEPFSLSLGTMLLNINQDEKKVIYRLVLANPFLLQRFSSGFNTLGDFINGISAQIPTNPNLIEVLLEQPNQPLLMQMSSKDLVTLVNNSLLFFKQLLVHQPVLFNTMSTTLFPFKISQYISQLCDYHQYRLTADEISAALTHPYNESTLDALRFAQSRISTTASDASRPMSLPLLSTSSWGTLSLFNTISPENSSSPELPSSGAHEPTLSPVSMFKTPSPDRRSLQESLTADTSFTASVTTPPTESDGTDSPAFNPGASVFAPTCSSK